MKLGLIALCAGALILAASAGGGFARKETQAPVVAVKSDDPDIALSRSQAQKTLAGFLAQAVPPAPNTEKHAVKVPLREGGKTEWVWVGKLRDIGGGRYAGILDNKPVDVTGFKIGQTIEFRREDVADWVYRNGSKMAGGYSVCILAAKKGDPKVIEKARELGFACG
jgi:uncharacterized protein YegJ (DUF2314 family)